MRFDILSRREAASSNSNLFAWLSINFSKSSIFADKSLGFKNSSSSLSSTFDLDDIGNLECVHYIFIITLIPTRSNLRNQCIDHIVINLNSKQNAINTTFVSTLKKQKKQNDTTRQYHQPHICIVTKLKNKIICKC